MLLRSASTPILKSLIPAAAAAASKEASHELTLSTDSLAPKIPKVRSMKTLSSSSSIAAAAAYSPTSSNSTTRLMREMSDDNISEPPPSKWKIRGTIPPSISISLEEDNKIDYTEEKRFPSSLSLSDDSYCRAHANAVVADDEGCVAEGNCYGHGSGGSICGSGGSRGGHSDSNTDDYYQDMIQANPGNSLVLGNYARFLKEVRGDVARAQEYCERAIVADQRDGDALSMYAEIIWESGKDAQRAETYFDRAIQAAPDDCYVMASYARFLWDAEEEEEEEKQGKNDVMESANWAYPRAAPPSVAAAS